MSSEFSEFGTSSLGALETTCSSSTFLKNLEPGDMFTPPTYSDTFVHLSAWKGGDAGLQVGNMAIEKFGGMLPIIK